MSYDPTNSTMYVGLSSFKEPASGGYAIFGDADGNGNPGGASAQMTAAGGIDSPNMGGDKAVALAIAAANPNTTPTTPIMIAGIPSEKSLAGSGTDGFTVAHFNSSAGMLQNDFGTALSGVTGNLAFNPSACAPRAGVFDLQLQGERYQSLARFLDQSLRRIGAGCRRG